MSRTVFQSRFPLPPPSLSPNAHANRMERGALRVRSATQYREDCYVLAVDARNRLRWSPPPSALVHYQFCLGGVRRGLFYAPKDWDNAIAAIKPLQDALVDAGIIIDDDWEHLGCGSVRHTRSDGRVLVTIEEVTR